MPHRHIIINTYDKSPLNKGDFCAGGLNRLFLPWVTYFPLESKTNRQNQFLKETNNRPRSGREKTISKNSRGFKYESNTTPVSTRDKLVVVFLRSPKVTSCKLKSRTPVVPPAGAYTLEVIGKMLPSNHNSTLSTTSRCNTSPRARTFSAFCVFLVWRVGVSAFYLDISSSRPASCCGTYVLLTEGSDSLSTINGGSKTIAIKGRRAPSYLGDSRNVRASWSMMAGGSSRGARRARRTQNVEG